MESIIHADIFFFISTIALIFIAAVVVVILIFIVTILNDLKKVTGRVRKESEEVIDDLHAFRIHIKDEGLTIRYLSGFLRRLFKRGKKD